MQPEREVGRAEENHSTQLTRELNNFSQRSIPFEGDVESFGDWDHGGLMLAIRDAGATLDFGNGGDLENAQDMSIAAPETGLTFTGTIDPANNIYRLGGGSGTITIAGDNKLTGGRDLVVTNGGDFKNPNGGDRVRLGMVRLEGAHGYSGVTTIIGKYQQTLQDQARRDAIGAGIENRAGAEEIQYNGTTLAVSHLGDGASSIGTFSPEADSLLIQGSTLRYEGAGETTNRVFTIGTAGATIDASGTGPIDFGSSSAIVMGTAAARSGGYDGIGFNGSESVVYDLGYTDDILIGMPISDSEGGIPGGTVVTEILSPTRVRISNNISQFAFADNATMTFGALDRTLTLAGSNTFDNKFTPLINDAPGGGFVGLTKTDTGKWIVDGANAYSGPTHVRAGTLIVNGTQTGVGDTTVDLAATLGGDGSIGGILLADGVVAPADGIGSLTVAGDATFSASSRLEIELSGLLAADQHDVLDVGGTLTINDATLSVVLSGFEPAAGNSFDILGFGSASGMFSDFVLPGNRADWDASRLLVDGTLRFLGTTSATGDFNGDGNYDCSDIDGLMAAITAGANDVSFDLTGDGVVDLNDRDGWLADAASANGLVEPYSLGDATLDGRVDAADLNKVGTSWLTSNPSWCSGNFNDQATVDAGDLNLLGVNWQKVVPSAAQQAAKVPEPDAAALLTLSVALIGLIHRRSTSC